MHAKVFLGNKMSLWALLGFCMQKFSLRISCLLGPFWGYQCKGIPWESDSWVMHANVSLGIRCLLGPFWGYACKDFPQELDVSLGHSGIMHAKVFPLESDVSLGHSGVLHAKVFLMNQMFSWAILGLCMQRFSLRDQMSPCAVLDLCMQKFILGIRCLLGPFWHYACKSFLWESNVYLGQRGMYTKVFTGNQKPPWPLWDYVYKGFPWKLDVNLGHSGVMHAKVFFGNQISLLAILG